jgi:hypothetical protein
MPPTATAVNVLTKALHTMGWQCQAARLAFSKTVKDPCPSCTVSAPALMASLGAAGFLIVAGTGKPSARALATLSKTMHEQGGWNDRPAYAAPPYHDACEGWARLVVECLAEAGYTLRARSS